MTKDKKLLYIISLTIFAVLLITLFVDIGSSRIVAACLLLPIAAITAILIKKRSSLSIQKREVLLLMTVLAILFVIIKEFTGVYFKFYKNPYFINIEKLLKFVIPSIVIIIAVEIIRYVLLAQKNLFVDIITFISCVIAEVLMFSNISGIKSFNNFMDLVAMTLFPAIIGNFLYHHISKHYGALPNIVYRAVTTLYIYFIPVTTGMTDALASCLKIVMPILLLAFLSALYSKKKKNAKQKGEKTSAVCTVLTVAVIISVAMLISCQFRLGALVIATESMTGEINKGDMIIYERYDGQPIKEGQVIVFQQNDARIVHRVIRIENIGGELRYFTKGDANEDPDQGYRIEADIVGLTDMKVAYVGYPTLWLRELIPD